MNDEDDIPSFFLRIAKNMLSFPLAFMINRSFSLETFPKTQKNAKFLPIFKKGNAKIISNYRPISLLPCISKIHERAIYNRRILFLIAIISLLPINSVLGKVIPQIMPSLI